jgi:hypothetical protein
MELVKNLDGSPSRPAALMGILGLSGDGLSEFDAATDYIGSTDADMASHVKVVAGFLLLLWTTANPDLKAQFATGRILEKLLRFRPADWALWLGLLAALVRQKDGLLEYFSGVACGALFADCTGQRGISSMGESRPW